MPPDVLSQTDAFLTPPTCLPCYPPLLTLTVIAFDVHNQHMHTHSKDTHTHSMHEHTHYCLQMKYTGVMCISDDKTFCFVQVQCLHMYTPHGVKHNSVISHIMGSKYHLSVFLCRLFLSEDVPLMQIIYRLFLSCKYLVHLALIKRKKNIQNVWETWLFIRLFVM